MQNPAFIALRNIFVMALFMIVAAFFHEGGHYYATKFYYPEEKLKVIYTKIFLIRVPTAIWHIEGTMMTRRQKIAVLLADPVVGFIPLIFLYFFSIGLFIEITLLYFVVACSVDFLSLIFYLVYPKLYRTGSKKK